MLSDPRLLPHLADVVLVVFLIELVWIILRRRAMMAGLAPTLLAGLALTLALRCALAGASVAWIAAFLLLAGISHVTDLALRHRAMRGSSSQPVIGHERTTP